MLDLDGASGGGQLLRTALALSACTGEAFRMTDVRGDRPNPGLRPQHLAAVETIGAICDADVDGAAVDSETVTFEPGEPTGGTYRTDIGTAGSVTLLFDAVLPLATRLDEPLAIEATGGTDVAWSPPVDYYRHVKLPVLRRRGLHATIDVERRGFYPAGGGRATLWIAPSSLSPIDLTERGSIRTARIYSTESASLAERSVAERQATAAERRLTDRSAVEVVERTLTSAESDSPGSAIVVRLNANGGLAGFDALGERGTPAERVGEQAADEALSWIDASPPVDRHLADQLVVFLALVGGRVRVPVRADHAGAYRDRRGENGPNRRAETRIDEHVETSLELLAAMGVDVERTDESGSAVLSAG